MGRIQRKLVEVKKWHGPICQHIQEKMEDIKKNATYACTWNGASKYQLKGPWGDQYVVDLREKTCNCRKWQLCGIPCHHAVTTIQYHGNNGGVGIVEEWVDECYTLTTQCNIYAHTVNPVNGPSMWEHQVGLNPIVAPLHHTQPGRPKKARRRDPDEGSGKMMRCQKCGNLGHNQRTCKGQGAVTRPRKSSKPSDTNGAPGSGNQGDGRDTGTGRGSRRGTGRSTMSGTGRSTGTNNPTAIGSSSQPQQFGTSTSTPTVFGSSSQPQPHAHQRNSRSYTTRSSLEAFATQRRAAMEKGAKR